MKQILTTCLAVCAGLILHAQPTWWINSPANMPTRSAQIFNAPPAGVLRHKFILQLEKGNRIEIYVHDKDQFLRLLNIDSVLQNAANALHLLKDSLSGNELGSKRIDYNTDVAHTVRIRVINYPAYNQYVLQKNELAALKTEQDTVIISGYMTDQTGKKNFKGDYPVNPYRIMLVLNHYDQLAGLINKGLESLMEQIRSEWNLYKPYNMHDNKKFNIYGYYNTTDPSTNLRVRNLWSKDQRRDYLAPYVHVSVQAINGWFSPSVAAGIELLSKQGKSDNHYQLMWEPHFNFDHSSGKNKLVRNDFISFQYINTVYKDNERSTIQFSQILSAGFLARRAGNYFEKNTFKFGFPGVRYKDVFLHPEFVFNDFFRNFQPSLKLMVYLD